ncbi:MAG: outer membrane lipoprotein-sorting protein [Bacteroidales bacterium]
MKHNISEKVFIVGFILAVSFHTAYSQDFMAREIVKKADDKGRGQTSQGIMTLKIVRPDWTRSITLKSWSKGTEYSLIYITAPAKEKGQVFLKRQNDMWNWVPSIERVIKIPPSMMMQSWMGSDYTNDDLVKESSIVTDYSQKLLGREKVRNMECYKIELIPLPDAAVTWGKVITWITVDGFNQWEAEYYDEDSTLVNVMNASDIKRMGDREIPTKLEIDPVNKKGNKTVLVINSMIFNQPISESFFSQQNMKSVK